MCRAGTSQGRALYQGTECVLCRGVLLLLLPAVPHLLLHQPSHPSHRGKVCSRNIHPRQCLLPEVTPGNTLAGVTGSTCRIQLEQFSFPGRQDSACLADSFTISSGQSANISSVGSFQEICGHKDGVEGENV